MRARIYRCILPRAARGAVALAVFLFTGVPGSLPFAATPPQISIIIDDLGNHRESGLEAVSLPGPLAVAFLPHTPYAAQLAEIAYQNGKEVILHIPMQSRSGRRLGPGAVTAGMDRIELMRVVSAGLRSVPHVSGVSNHMGSLLTSRRDAMGWLMDLLRVRGNLFFVDSLTTGSSRALEVAQQRRVPSTTRDVFLDAEVDEAEIYRAFERLLRIAKRRGSALAIGHPHQETLKVLADMIPRLDDYGVRLVPVTSLIRTRQALRPPLPASAPFRSLRAAGSEPDHVRARFFNRAVQSSLPGHAASTRYTPRPPRIQVINGAPATTRGE